MAASSSDAISARVPERPEFQLAVAQCTCAAEHAADEDCRLP
jgi:hypothetical protein